MADERRLEQSCDRQNAGQERSFRHGSRREFGP